MPAGIIPFIPMIAGAVSGVVKGVQGAHQRKLDNKITVPDVNPTDSPWAKAVLGQAQQMAYARMPGAANAERNIMTNQANSTASIERNATSGAQALSLLGGVQGQSNQAFQNLATQEGQFGLQTQSNLQGVNMNFADQVFQNQMRKQLLAIQQKNALGMASTQNMGGGMNDIMNGAMSYALINAQKKA